MKKQQKIYLDEETEVLIETLENTKSGAANSGLRALSYGFFLVFKAENHINKRVLIGVDKTSDYFNLPIIVRILGGNGLISTDIKNCGREVFETKILGLFPTKQAAILYKDKVINDEMDKGTIVYNNEVYSGEIPRIVSIKMGTKLFRILALISKKNKTTINKLIIGIIKKFIKKD